jgi:copper chaperone CopZ
MAGPATNAATISVIGNAMGKKTMYLYLASIITGALFSGFIIDTFLPREWFTGAMSHIHEGHNHDLLPMWLRAISGILITLALLNVFIYRIYKRFFINTDTNIKASYNMNTTKIYVRGMTCSHCKMTVESNLKKISGIENTLADLDTQIVTIMGENIDLKKIQETVEGIGYKYDGKVA